MEHDRFLSEACNCVKFLVGNKCLSSGLSSQQMSLSFGLLESGRRNIC